MRFGEGKLAKRDERSEWGLREKRKTNRSCRCQAKTERKTNRSYGCSGASGERGAREGEIRFRMRARSRGTSGRCVYISVGLGPCEAFERVGPDQTQCAAPRPRHDTFNGSGSHDQRAVLGLRPPNGPDLYGHL